MHESVDYSAAVQNACLHMLTAMTFRPAPAPNTRAAESSAAITSAADKLVSAGAATAGASPASGRQ